jgi:hypothetical protein
LHLVEDEMLEIGCDITEKDEGEFLLGSGKLGFEVGKDIQFGRESVPIIHVLFVASVPAESFALSDLKSGKIDFPVFPYRPVVGWEVIPDDANQADGGVETGGKTRKRGGASQKIGTVFLKGFNPINAD